MELTNVASGKSSSYLSLNYLLRLFGGGEWNNSVYITPSSLEERQGTNG